MEGTPDCLLHTDCFFLQKQSSGDSHRNILDTVDGGTLRLVSVISSTVSEDQQEVKENSPPEWSECLLETESHIEIWTHQLSF